MAVTTPPLEPVRTLQAALISGGVPCVVGGSALLAARGLIERVNDWDLVVDAERGSDGVRVDVSTTAEPGAFGLWHGMRLGRADEWAHAYRAMGRESRAALLAT
ncbi:hypothetical protein EV140_0317 [Microcella alkaliphila]|uniref:Uncharacterized protein n=1 Tax=Microcella alkaliphila TaxID=279828 RepID=A0A4Q7TUW9_9MICO|nr:hypothetical protein [Microcella alkaliphila]RZT64080.1 hypothetical protein EV140_0317 [Microcella alkaliphila]